MKLVLLTFVLASAGQFDGKVCYITGGTSGLGKAAALEAGREGCKTVVTGRRAEKGEAVVKEIKDAGGEATFIKCDVTDAKAVESSIEATVEKYGALNYAFNNAGGASAGDFLAPHEMSVEDFQFMTNLNLNSVFYSAKFQVTKMLEGGYCKDQGCSIVNCASIYSVVATPNVAGYTATKHALVGLTKAFALAYADKGIRINNINPGYSPSELTGAFVTAEEHGARTVSDWHPAGRWLKNSEVVDGLFWLWSDKSTFYNGQNLILDSGMTGTYVPPATYSKQMGAAMAKLGELAEAEKKEEL